MIKQSRLSLQKQHKDLRFVTAGSVRLLAVRHLGVRVHVGVWRRLGGDLRRRFGRQAPLEADPRRGLEPVLRRLERAFAGSVRLWRRLEGDGQAWKRSMRNYGGLECYIIRSVAF